MKMLLEFDGKLDKFEFTGKIAGLEPRELTLREQRLKAKANRLKEDLKQKEGELETAQEKLSYLESASFKTRALLDFLQAQIAGFYYFYHPQAKRWKKLKPVRDFFETLDTKGYKLSKVKMTLKEWGLFKKQQTKKEAYNGP